MDFTWKRYTKTAPNAIPIREISWRSAFFEDWEAANAQSFAVGLSAQNIWSTSLKSDQNNLHRQKYGLHILFYLFTHAFYLCMSVTAIGHKNSFSCVNKQTKWPIEDTYSGCSVHVDEMPLSSSIDRSVSMDWDSQVSLQKKKQLQTFGSG